MARAAAHIRSTVCRQPSKQARDRVCPGFPPPSNERAASLGAALSVSLPLPCSILCLCLFNHRRRCNVGTNGREVTSFKTLRTAFRKAFRDEGRQTKAAGTSLRRQSANPERLRERTGSGLYRRH